MRVYGHDGPRAAPAHAGRPGKKTPTGQTRRTRASASPSGPRNRRTATAAAAAGAGASQGWMRGCGWGTKVAATASGVRWQGPGSGIAAARLCSLTTGGPGSAQKCLEGARRCAQAARQERGGCEAAALRSGGRVTATEGGQEAGPSGCSGWSCGQRHQSWSCCWGGLRKGADLGCAAGVPPGGPQWRWRAQVAGAARRWCPRSPVWST